MMNEEELHEPMPCVIKESLLQIGIREGLTDLERERLDDSQKPGNEGKSTMSLSPPDIKVLRLCFMYIRRIDNLQCYTGLKELYLANNCITKIENLAVLTSLTKLDLSFNQINDVDDEGHPFNPFEGLTPLVNLEELSIFKNKITRLDEFPELPKLRFLSLGRNNISELSEVQNLYKIKSLRILTLVGNPIASKDICKLTVLAYLQNLHFLDYVRVTKNDIQDARERLSDQLNTLQQAEDTDKQYKDRARAEEAQKKTLSDAFLIKISDLNTSLFKGDNDYQKLNTIRELGEPTALFTDDITKATNGFVADIIAQAHSLKMEEELFNSAYKKVTEENQLQMIQVVKRLDRKRRAFLIEASKAETMNEEEAQLEEDESQKIMDEITKTEDELLTSEFALVDMVAEMIRAYELELDERINVITEKIALFFGTLRNLNSEYNEKVNDICMKLWERFNQGEAVEVSDEVRSILVDKDAMTSTIQASNEHRNTKIYKREEGIGNAYKQRIDQMISTAKQNDLERNRKRVAEITKYIQNTIEAIKSADGDDYDQE
ncbi:Leucine Rich Repeat family protein [Trichomonas vaginalis G3]|uniref:Dynein regulatory complex subunit 3 n=1 Tax=Trichomonas vaginalis (strain ATCC PRA-98 / G3) TaxID=412133 RepID=A2EYF4_TRIV3|nr:uncharacterized protein TVAGG3_0864100 [Trichomonas vaginalis G3]EAY02307.1 Leucine Rich Repeat family protein [Trichomonas vaginalis G3]KAI5500890.1 axoneme assembly [Trichomonas vaginalis G3]|eukprot:XP_001314622.1 hypothetical protein [Trichomonas vaginalis G3]